MARKYIFYFIVLIIMLFLLTGCSGIEGESKTASVEEKSSSEIEYLQDKIFTLINKYSKGEYLEDDAINWKNVNKDALQIGKVLDTLMLDFGEAKISNEDLNKFRTEINNLLVASGGENEQALLTSASNLYSLLPDYYGKFSNDNNKKDIMNLKSLVLSSYINSYFLNWQEAKTKASSAETKYKEMADNLEYMKEYSYSLNKIYILVEEFKNAVDLEQADLAKTKYINFIEKI